MIWREGEINFYRVCCRLERAFGDEEDPPDGFPPSFSLLRLTLPDQSEADSCSHPSKRCSSFSHPTQDLSFSEQEALGLPPGDVCVCVYRFLSWGLCCPWAFASRGTQSGFPITTTSLPCEGNKSHFLISVWLLFSLMIFISGYFNLSKLSCQIQQALT